MSGVEVVLLTDGRAIVAAGIEDDGGEGLVVVEAGPVRRVHRLARGDVAGIGHHPTECHARDAAHGWVASHV